MIFPKLTKNLSCIYLLTWGHLTINRNVLCTLLRTTYLLNHWLYLNNRVYIYISFKTFESGHNKAGLLLGSSYSQNITSLGKWHWHQWTFWWFILINSQKKTLTNLKILKPPKRGEGGEPLSKKTLLCQKKTKQTNLKSIFDIFKYF